MRNLKKVLALALATVMMFGMMVVGASAAYTDTVGNDYATAIDVVSAVEIITGNNGAFNPNGNLCRGDAALLAARVGLTPEDAAKLTAVGTAFSDVAATDYYAGAVAWAAKEGYINGFDGKFDPKGDLQGIAFAKILLNVLGYQSDAEGFANVSWNEFIFNVNYLAAKAGLLDGMEGVDLTKTMTRAQAAQMALNAMQAQQVWSYTTQVLPINGEWTVVKEANVPTTGNSLIDTVYTELHYNEYASTANTPAYVEWTIDGAIDPIATEVVLAPAAINAKTDLSKLTTVAGLKANVNGNLGATLANVDAVKALCVPGNTVEVYVDNKVIVAVNVASETLVDVSIDYDEATEIYTFDLSTIAGDNLNTTTVTFNKAEDADNTLYNALVALDLDVVYGDVILVSTYAGNITALEKAITTTGKVTKYVADKAVTVNGVEYALAGQYAQTNAIAVKAEQTLYLDNAGNVLTAVTVPNAPVVPNTIYVAKVTTTPEWNGSAYVSDGTYTVAGFDLSGAAVTVTTTVNPDLNKLYSYTTDQYGISTLAPAGTLQDNSSKGDTTVVIYPNDIMETTDTYFFAENVTFLYIYDTDDVDNVVSVNAIETGVQKIVGKVNYVYVLNAQNMVTHVIVEGAPYVETSFESGIVYLGAQIDSTNVDYYAIAEDGKTETSNFEVLMDGEKFVVTQVKGSETTYEAGFYYYNVDAKGVVTLTKWYEMSGSNKYYNQYSGKVLDGTTNKIQLINGNYYLSVGSKLINITDADVYGLDLETSCNTVARLATLANSAKYGDVTISIRYTYSSGLNFGLEIYVNNIVEG